MHRQKYEINILNVLNILVYKTLSFLQKYFPLYICWIVDKDENIHILHIKNQLITKEPLCAVNSL